MKLNPQHFRAIVLCLLTCIPGATAFGGNTNIWFGPGAGLNSWTVPNNWTNATLGNTAGLVGGDDVKLFNTGGTTYSNINSVVDSNLTVGSIVFSSTAGTTTHTLLITNGITLTVTNTAGIAVGATTDLGVGLNVTNVITGVGGTLILSNATGFFGVNQANGTGNPSRGNLNMNGLDTFIATASRIGIGDGQFPGVIVNNHDAGNLLLAKTNLIALTYTDTLANYQTAGKNSAITVSRNSGNNAGIISILQLGQKNTFYVDSLNFGMDKSGNNSTSAHGVMNFSSAFAANNPTAFFRGVNGATDPTSRVTWWSVGDGNSSGSTSNGGGGTNDFSLGSIDALVNVMSLGRDAAVVDTWAGPHKGVFTFAAGTVDVNTLIVGNQSLETGASSTPCLGIMNVVGPAAVLKVNTAMNLGPTTLATTAATATSGNLFVNGGTVLANRINVGAASITNTIRLNNATFVVTNTFGTNAAVFAFATTNSLLGLTVQGNGLAAGSVGTLTTGGISNLIQLDPRAIVFSSYPRQVPLIRYTNWIGTNNFVLTNIPAWAPGATLVSNGPNNSLDLLLPIDPRPLITSVTPSYAGNPGDNVSFTVTYTGVTPLFVQWQENGSNVVNRTTGDGSVVSGATADTVSINNAQPSDSGNYTAVVTNAFGSVTSAPPSVLVISLGDVAPIVTGPNNVTAIQGSTANITASIAGKPVPAVQWQRGGTNINGATSPTLSIPNVQFPSDQGTYFVIATNNAGAVTNSAFLTVIVPPVITNQPVSLVVTNTQSATFTAGASGVPAVSYQWKKNNNPIPGATSPTFTIASVSSADTANYFVTITNLAGATNSVTVSLTVNSTMSATTLTPNNGAVGICYDTPLSITFSQVPTLRNFGTIKIYNSNGTPVDTNDLSLNNTLGVQGHSTFPGDAQAFNYFPVVINGNTAVIYPHGGVMTSNQTYYVTIDDGVFADSTGAYFAGISATNTWRFSTKAGGPVDPSNPIVAADGSGDFVTVQGGVDSMSTGNGTRRVINIRNGIYFEIVDIAGKTNITLRGQSRIGTVIKYPNNASLQPSGTTQARMTFKVNASEIALENLWITNSTPQGGSQAEALMINSNARHCVVNGCDLSSRQDTILANANSSQVYFFNCRVYGNFDYIWGGGNLYFDRCTIHCITGTGSGNTTAARTDTSLTQSAATPWLDPNGTTYSANGFSFVNCTFEEDPGVVNITLAGSNGTAGGQVSWAFCKFDPAAYIKPLDTLTNQYLFWQYSNTDLAGVTPVTFANLTTLTNGSDSRLLAATNIPTWFYGWVPTLAPNILTNPVSQSVSAGGSANFGVLATGIPNPAYQWLKNGAPISGATNTSFAISGAHRSDGAGYSVAVSNIAGVVTSTVATLTYTGNVNPVANPAAFSRNSGFNLKIAISSLGWTDADGDALTFTTINSTNGATVAFDANYIYYSNPNNVADEIDYTISDGNGGTASSFITVTIAAASSNQTANILGQSVDGNGFVTINFAGIPNYTYWVEATTNLVTPDWQPISTNTAGPNGLWNFTDTNAPNFPARFYRSFKP